MSPPLPPAFALPSSPLPPFSGLVSPSSLDDRVSKSLLPKFAQQCLSLRLRLSYFNGLRIDTKPMMQPGSKQTDGKISRQDAKPLRKELEAERQIPTVLGFFCDLLCLFAQTNRRFPRQRMRRWNHEQKILLMDRRDLQVRSRSERHPQKAEVDGTFLQHQA